MLLRERKDRSIARFHPFSVDTIKITSRPTARDGHQYPCAALGFCNGRYSVNREAALEGTGGDKVCKEKCRTWGK